MTDASVAPSTADLFRKWKEFLHGGTLPAADAVAVADPQLTGPLHKLIDAYLAGRVTDVIGPDPEPDGPAELPTIPGYAILGLLGRGGMGEVYHVRDPLDREWALKLARHKQLSATGLRRFLAEAKAMHLLDHPNVAKVHDYKENDGRPYFTMALYPANLSDRWADYCAGPEAAVRLMLAVADGVGHLHRRGFIHRDLKPSNILVDAAGRPVVSDFGLIKPQADGDSSADDSGANGSAETHATGARRAQTVVGLVLGTRRYMAPEQAAGLNHLAGPAWDVWALGVMLHELLTGQPPRSSAAPERLLSPGEPDNLPLSKIKPGLDPRLTRVVHKCLARDPADRYPDAAAVAADLRGWLTRGRRLISGIAAALVLAAMAGTATTAALWANDPETEASAGPLVVHAGLTAEPPAPTREDTLAAFQRRLEDGKTADVIGPEGMPVWFEVVPGSGGGPYVSAVDGTLRLNTDEMILMDLPPTGLDRFRFEVQVRQHANGPTGDFGVYAGRHRLPSTTGQEVDCFASVWFNDWVNAGVPGVRADQPGLWLTGVRHHKWVPKSGSVIGGRQFAGGGYAPKGPGDAERWHTLAVEVGPNRMTCFFDENPAGSIDLPLAPAYETFFTRSAMLRSKSATDFSPAGGYGLVVFGGPAAFRNARVGPPGK